ncbi:MAG: EthD family reductase [Ignavibacteriales bacterium CG07_land_8_20_14_0_80_59_12]|nr:MAG: EthD family reductase [Ignavibacteriales bacterium CG07_land_8_20_14_0_80_59_12]
MKTTAHPGTSRIPAGCFSTRERVYSHVHIQRRLFEHPPMVKLIVLFRRPDDAGGFDSHFFDSHLPLLKALPRLKGVAVNKVIESPLGERPYHLVVELSFESEDDLRAALASREGRDEAKDLLAFAPELTSLISVERL